MTVCFPLFIVATFGPDNRLYGVLIATYHMGIMMNVYSVNMFTSHQPSAIIKQLDSPGPLFVPVLS